MQWINCYIYSIESTDTNNTSAYAYFGSPGFPPVYTNKSKDDLPMAMENDGYDNDTESDAKDDSSTIVYNPSTFVYDLSNLGPDLEHESEYE